MPLSQSINDSGHRGIGETLYPIEGGSKEIGPILNKYRNKLYVFVAPADAIDLQIRDRIAVALVRVAQAGNMSARAELVDLVRYTIDGWLDNYYYMSRWRGREVEIRKQLEGCIRRYRYSGSFLRYVFRRPTK
jgi:hypothetical protein